MGTMQRLLCHYKHRIRHSDVAHPISTWKLMDMLDETNDRI